MKVKCRVCYGSKKRMGMGNIPRDCDICDKTGWIEKETMEIVPQLDIYETVEDKEVEAVSSIVESAAGISPEQEKELKDFAEELKSSETCDPFDVTDTCSIGDIFPGVTDGIKEFIDDFSPKKKGRPKKA